MYNQYSPYGYYTNYNYSPYGNQVFQNQKTSLFKKNFLSGVPKQKFNWNHFLDNTQRTLGVINQAIPIVYQVKPILANAKTMFRIASAIEDVAAVQEVEKVGTENEQTERDRQIQNEEKRNGTSPQFFL